MLEMQFISCTCLIQLYRPCSRRVISQNHVILLFGSVTWRFWSHGQVSQDRISCSGTVQLHLYWNEWHGCSL